MVNKNQQLKLVTKLFFLQYSANQLYHKLYQA